MTIRIGVLGDSHCQSPDELHPSVTAALAGCDRIVHLGDVSVSGVLDRLEEIAPVVGVTSKTDPEDPRLKGTATELDDPAGLVAIRRSLTGDEVFDPRVQVVLHGGTHDHSVAMRAGRLFVNPGSTRWAKRGPSLAIVSLEDSSAISVEMVAVSDG